MGDDLRKEKKILLSRSNLSLILSNITLPRFQSSKGKMRWAKIKSVSG